MSKHSSKRTPDSPAWQPGGKRTRGLDPSLFINDYEYDATWDTGLSTRGRNSSQTTPDQSTGPSPVLSSFDHQYNNLPSSLELMPTPRTLPEVWTFINSQIGPRDHFRTLEDVTTFKGLSFKPENLWAQGVPEFMIREWLCGADIIFNDNQSIPIFDVNNYSSVSLHEELAAAELNRIIKDNKAILYPINIRDDNPHIIPGLSRSPGHMVFRKERLRWVTGTYLDTFTRVYYSLYQLFFSHYSHVYSTRSPIHQTGAIETSNSISCVKM